MSGGMQRFEPYAVSGGVASAYRAVDSTVSEVRALRRENQTLRREKAAALACADAERAESARLRGENQRLSNELATAKMVATAGRMTP